MEVTPHFWHDKRVLLTGHTGFKGRTGIFEAIVMNDAVEEAVLRDPREHVILEAARPQGIPTMAEDGIIKVLNGTTSLAELERVIELPRKSSITPTPKTPTPQSDTGDTDFLAHVL